VGSEMCIRDSVTDDIDRRFVFNTPIAAIMELVNDLSRAPEDPAARFAAETPRRFRY